MTKRPKFRAFGHERKLYTIFWRWRNRKCKMISTRKEPAIHRSHFQSLLFFEENENGVRSEGNWQKFHTDFTESFAETIFTESERRWFRHGKNLRFTEAIFRACSSSKRTKTGSDQKVTDKNSTRILPSHSPKPFSQNRSRVTKVQSVDSNGEIRF